jgi:hypothetical protein
MNIQDVIGGGDALRGHGERLLVKTLKASEFVRSQKQPVFDPALLVIGRAHLDEAAPLLDDFQLVAVMDRNGWRRTWANVLAEHQRRRAGKG